MAGSAAATCQKVALQVTGPFDGIQDADGFCRASSSSERDLRCRRYFSWMVIGLFGGECATRMAEYRHRACQKKRDDGDPACVLLVV